MGAKIIKKLSIGKLPCFFLSPQGLSPMGFRCLKTKKMGFILLPCN